MPSSARTAVMALALSVASVLPAAAQQAADDSCTGTLCDLYYSTHPRPQAPQRPAGTPQGATPLTVPRTGTLSSMLGWGDSGAAAPAGAQQAPTSNVVPGSEPGTVKTGVGPVGVQGGGLIGALAGAPAERCSGTLCDLYYGGSSPEPSAAAPPSSAPMPRERVADDNGAEPAPRARRRHIVEEAVEKPRCAAPANDPWRCYR